MILITNKQNCSGCGACRNICPENAITMMPDEEGFVYPVINQENCINCGLCEKICPILNQKTTTKVLKTYAAKNKNIETLKKSSSGGMFSIFAEEILKQGGVVFGAAYNDKWGVEHTFVDKMEYLDKLRRSKYVQSDICETYKKAKEFLDKGYKVLFSGTPCQIAGIKSYLQKSYDNLLTIDIFCHSIASPKVWEMFLHQNFNLGNIKKIDFRDKIFSWDKSCLKIYFEKSESVPKLPLIFGLLPNKIKQKLICGYYSLSYMKGCLSGLFTRPSCHYCKFKGVDKNSDFTIGDLWGVNDIAPDFYDTNGVSVLTINSAISQNIFEKIKDKLIWKEIPLDKVIIYNSVFYNSTKPHKNRAEFFKWYQKEPLNKLIPKLLGKTSLIKLIVNRISKNILISSNIML